MSLTEILKFIDMLQFCISNFSQKNYLNINEKMSIRKDKAIIYLQLLFRSMYDLTNQAQGEVSISTKQD